MRRSALLSLLLLLPLVPLAALPAHADKPRQPKPALPAAQYPLHETHSRITIAAEPCDVKDSLPNTRLDYAHHGYLPFRIIVTNDSEQAVSLDDARIKFISPDNTVVQAATDEELQRRLFSRKSTQPTHIPLPLPLPAINIKREQVDQKIVNDEKDFGFPTTTIAPHTTVSGYLYYDTRDLDEPLLSHATLEVRRVRVVASNEELESFEIALKPTPEAPKPAVDPAKGPADPAKAPTAPADGK
jgi:hypothetical protein